MTAAEPGDLRPDEPAPEGARRGDLQQAAAASLARLDHARRLPAVVDQPARIGKKHPPFVGQRERPRGALEQLAAEFGLEPAELAGDAGFGGAELARGAGEMAGLGDLQKHMDVGEDDHRSQNRVNRASIARLN